MRSATLIGSIILTVSIFCTSANAYEAEGRNYNYVPNTEYYIQTDEGPERYFRFQTLNGQFRKEKRLADGTVVGTEAWIDPFGYLRYKDYIADHQGYRILRSKVIYVGKDTPIHDALSRTKNTPAQSGVLVKSRRPPNPFRKPERNAVTPLSRNNVRTGYYTPTTIKPITIAPYLTQSGNNYYPVSNGPTYAPPIVGSQNAKDYGAAVDSYDGGKSVQPNQLHRSSVSVDNSSPKSRSNLADDNYSQNEVHRTANGFEYYLKRQYHEEEREPNGESIGSFGYIDPFGIRRVIYYKTDPQTGGFVHKKNNRYVGFNAKPYDPLPGDLSRTRRTIS